MSNIVDQLKQNQASITKLQTEQARQEGQRDQLLRQLKDKFGIDSIVKGEEKLLKLKSEHVEIEGKIEELNDEMDEII